MSFYKKHSTKEKIKFTIEPGLAIMNTWKHFCFTYEVVNKSVPAETEVKMIGYFEGIKKTEGIFNDYPFGNSNGFLVALLVNLTFDEYFDLELNGVLMFGQEQDKVGGGTSLNQGLSGDYAQINMWDRPLTPDEVSEMALCKFCFDYEEELSKKLYLN